MWVFGYGSLMWDGWERERDCVQRTIGVLRGYSRTFNKLSVRNWGTKANPGPTLNLVRTAGECRGIAFQFDDVARGSILDYLAQREGKGFALSEHPIELADGTTVHAIVPLYQRKNLASSKDTAALVHLARRARGTSGACADYIRNVTAHLTKIGIEDAAVNEFCRALNEAP